MTERIRIGAVNYLNTKPLVYELEALAPQAELILDFPAGWRTSWRGPSSKSR